MIEFALVVIVLILGGWLMGITHSGCGIKSKPQQKRPPPPAAQPRSSFDRFGLPIVNTPSVMPKCKPPFSQNLNDQKIVDSK